MEQVHSGICELHKSYAQKYISLKFYPETKFYPEKGKLNKEFLYESAV